MGCNSSVAWSVRGQCAYLCVLQLWNALDQLPCQLSQVFSLCHWKWSETNYVSEVVQSKLVPGLILMIHDTRYWTHRPCMWPMQSKWVKCLCRMIDWYIDIYIYIGLYWYLLLEVWLGSEIRGLGSLQGTCRLRPTFQSVAPYLV